MRQISFLFVFDFDISVAIASGDGAFLCFCCVYVPQKFSIRVNKNLLYFFWRHVLDLSGHDAGRSVHSMWRVLSDFIAECLAACAAVILMLAGKLHALPSHQRKTSALRNLLAGHQPMLGGGPLCHVVISVPPRCRAKKVPFLLRP
jgi:hypothetical protein